MRWAFVVVESFAIGVLTLFVALLAFIVASHFYAKYVLRVGSGQAVGWDPVPCFGSHWAFVLLSILILIFVSDFGAGFWFLSRRLRSRS